MRISNESHNSLSSSPLLRLLLLLSIILLSNIESSKATYTWADCGEKLDRIFTYHSVTVYPDPIVGGEQVAINIAAVIIDDHLYATEGNTLFTQQLIWTGNELEIDYNGVEMLFVNTTDMCDLTRVITCPMKPEPVSYTDVFNVPNLPAGSYTFRVRNLFGQEYFQREIGCLEVTVEITDPKVTGCTFTSFAKAQLESFDALFEDSDISQRAIGSFIEVGPVWGDPTLPWGTFESLNASSDLLISGGYNPVDLVWGLNGTLYSKTPHSTGSVSLSYSGTFFVGYNGVVYPQFLTPDNALLTGTFDWTFLYASSISTTFTLSGTLDIQPALGFQPLDWPYILGFGRLDNFTIQSSSDGSSYIVSASKTISTCPNTGSSASSNVASNQVANLNPASNWNEDQKWALGLGLVAFFLLVLIPLLIYMAWRQRKNEYYLNDDDLVDPLKPDYGSLAINDIIDEAEDLPRQQ